MRPGPDPFFPPEDCEADAALIPNGHFRPIETPMGHFGMFGLRPEDPAALDVGIAEMLASENISDSLHGVNRPLH